MLLKDYNFQCEPCDYSTSRKGLFLLNLTYYYFLLKVLDLFDTVRFNFDYWNILPTHSWIRLQLFIILRKKNAHLSFLHCYHHFFMCFGTYVGELLSICSKIFSWFIHAIIITFSYFLAVRWLPGGHSSMLGIVNAFVHGFMYFYYFLSALKPNLSRSVWKKRITQIQLVTTTARFS